MTERVEQILSWYESDPPGVVANLRRLLMHGRLGGSGKMVILPVDQGFEHGPARSFAKNPPAYDPHYHFQLALDAGCNAYAAPLGFLDGGARKYAGRIPLILKLNNSDTMNKTKDPCPAVTSSVKDALRLGCAAIGYTIYPGSSERNTMYEKLRGLIEEARAVGLPTVVWSYPRGSALSKEGETAVDITGYAAQVAALLGAHIVKIKPPTAHIEHEEAKKSFEEGKIPIGTLEDRVRHLVQSTFNGRRILIFSGGAAKGTQEVLDEVRALAKGGAFGSIIGRNAFTRPKAQALELLDQIMKIYEDTAR
jgi:class I fructose-bisphosphate aldolase